MSAPAQHRRMDNARAAAHPSPLTHLHNSEACSHPTSPRSTMAVEVTLKWMVGISTN
jgi:hypothetical protein